MAELRLNLLSRPAEILIDGAPNQRLATGKALGLMAYLAVEGGVHTRSEIATLLWGESTEQAARSSLRQVLKRLRDALGTAIRVDRNEVELADPYSCDVWDFLDAISSNSVDVFEYAITEFLRDDSIRNAPGFERWVDVTTRNLQARFEAAAHSMGREAVARSDWGTVLRCADGWLDVSPNSSDGMHLAMNALFMLGRADESLSRFRIFSQRYEADMGFEVPRPLIILAKKMEGTPRSSVSVNRGDTSEPVFESPMVGRSAEWQQLMEGWKAVEQCVGRVFLLEGEEGVGKSRLAGEFCHWAMTEGALVLKGQGYDPRAGVPYGPVAEALRSALDEPALAGAAPTCLAEATIILPELKERFRGLSAPSDPRDTGRRSRLFESLSQMLLALCDDQSLVLFIDDLQWCDSETCALLHFFSRRLRSSRTVLVLCLTHGQLDRDMQAARFSRAIKTESRTSVLSLDPLSIEHTTELLHLMGRVTSATGGNRLAARIQELTDGNPFYTIEILKTLFQKKMLEVDSTTGEWVTNQKVVAAHDHRIELPRTVRAAVGARVDVLPYELRDLMATIAVSARGIDVDSIASVHGASRLRIAALAEALVERLLVKERNGRYYAAHRIVADVVREDLTKSRRRQIHAAVAMAMQLNTGEQGKMDVAGEIARHAELGQDSAMAYRWGLTASEAAMERFASNEALSWLDVSAQHAATDEEKDEVNRRTARILDDVGLSPGRREMRGGSEADGLVIRDVDLRVRTSGPQTGPVEFSPRRRL